jgi:hypothetical protein
VDDKFFVDYEGVITRRITGAGHEVGSAVSGRLLIDLTKAGDDAYPDDPNQTAFGNENDFITGFIAPSDDWPPSDVVGWLNGRDGGSDFFNLVDGQGADEFNFRRLTGSS